MANPDESSPGGSDSSPPHVGAYHGKPGEVIDPRKVDVFRCGRSLEVKPGEIKVGKDGLVQPTQGLSLDTDPANLVRFGGASKVRSIPDELRIVQRGKRATHFEVLPEEMMTPDRYQELVRRIDLE